MEISGLDQINLNNETFEEAIREIVTNVTKEFEVSLQTLYEAMPV